MKRAEARAPQRNGASLPTRAQLLEEVRRLREELILEQEAVDAHEQEVAETLRKLEASRKRYVELYDRAPVGHVSLDYNGCIDRINVTGARLLGGERSHLRRTPFLVVVAKADRRKFMDHLSRCRKDSGEVATELRLHSRDGSERIIQIVSAPGDTDDLAKNRFPTVLTDITARKQAEDALRESESRFRIMAESAPVLIWTAGPDKLCTYVNRRWLEFTGRTLEQEVGSGWAEDVHPDDLARCQEIFTRSYDTRQEFEMEYRLRRHDGEYRWVVDHGSPRFAAPGEFAGFLGSCVDITESKIAREALRRAHDELEQRVAERTASLLETEQRYRQLVEVLPDAVLVVRNDCIVLANPAAQELFGAGRPEQLIDQPVLERVQPGSQSFVHDFMQQALHQMLLPTQIEQKVVRLDGTVRDVQIAADRFSEHGEAGVLLVFKDITERKRLEKRLLEITEQEQQRIGQELHDGLCQQLTALKFKAALLEQKLRKRFRFGPRGFAEIETRLNRIIEETRTVARGLSPVSLNINGLGAALHELAGEVATMTKIPCDCRVDKNAEIADATVAMHLYRIAQEALNNAVKHSRGKQLWLRLARRDGRLTLTVRDNGVGFSLAKGGKPGLGLHNMDYRARVIGGTLEMLPLTGGGLQVTCALPDPGGAVNNKDKASHARKKNKASWRK